MNKFSLKLVILCLAVSLTALGCASTNGGRSVGGAAAGCGLVAGLIGGIVSAVTGEGNPWMVSVLGGVGGAALCGTAAAVSNASVAKSAAQSNEMVEATNRNTGETIRSVPIAESHNGQCRTTRTSTYKNGELVSQEDKEFCTQEFMKDIRR